MKLYHVDWSPFARKVRIAAIERGINDQIELIEIFRVCRKNSKNNRK